MIRLLILLICAVLPVSVVHAGEAFLSWQAPTKNVNGTPLTDLAGYRIYRGSSPGSYSSIPFATVGKGFTSTRLTNLPSGTHYFVVTAFDTSGNESGYSVERSKVIDDGTPPKGDLIPPAIPRNLRIVQ